MASPWQALALFSPVLGPPGSEALIRNGPLPWWTHPELKLSLWRPLSSLLMWLDVAAFGRQSVWLYHLHSAAWYLAVIAACAVLLRRALPGAIGAGALLLFAIDGVHWMSVTWLAQRNALVAAAPALLALAAHVRWREEGWRPGLPLSLLGFVVGLAGGEAALGVYCYLVAYELCGGWRPGRWLVALAPSAALAAGHFWLYRRLGFGARGSGVYLDPLGSPWTFVAALPERLLALSAGQLLTVPADLRPRAVPLVGGLLALALVAVVLGRAWSTLTSAERGGARWLLVGGVLSLVPVAATAPHNRLLLLPSLGGAVLVAILVRHGWTARRRWERAVAYGLVLVHVPLALSGWAVGHYRYAVAGPWAEEVLLASHLDVVSRRVVLVVAPDFATTAYAPSVRAYRERPLPRSWWTLSAAPYDHRLTRTGVDRFELEVLGGRMLTTIYERVFRGPDPPLRAGTQVALEGATVTVLEADAVGPRRVAFHFTVPLEDPSLLILEWRDGRLLPMPLPAIGASRELPRTPGPLTALGF